MYTQPSADELLATFVAKYGPVEHCGWAPRRRLAAGYYTPADVYETVVAAHVQAGARWLDVGGGHDVFPDNPALARQLVSRAGRVTAVDPSDNVRHNHFVHERIQDRIEEFRPRDLFDLVTMRMVVEHVQHPERFAAAVAALSKPGATAIVFTPSRWSPISIASRLAPFHLHHGLKRMFWGGDERDTFPTFYRMNTCERLRQTFSKAGFDEVGFARLDDLSLFGQFRTLGRIELLAWQALNRLGIGYPESCLLGVYRRRTALPTHRHPSTASGPSSERTGP